MIDSHQNPEVIELAQKLIREEVRYCVSFLVSSLADAASKGATIEGADFETEIMPLLEREDWISPAIDALKDAAACDLARVIKKVPYMRQPNCISDPDEFDRWEPHQIESARHDLTSQVTADTRLARDACECLGVNEPYLSEVYEHWAVSEWFANELATRGEAVGDICGITIWGRTTTGQSLSMDSVILEIAAELLRNRTSILETPKT